MQLPVWGPGYLSRPQVQRLRKHHLLSIQLTHQVPPSQPGPGMVDSPETSLKVVG